MEPSETQPLPPRELPFPERPPLSVVGLPLDPGPDLGHADLLILPGAVVKDVVLQPAGEAAPAAEAPAEPAAPAAGGSSDAQARQEREERARKTYDRLWEEGQSSPWYGVVELEGVADRFVYEGDGVDYSGVVVRFRPYSLVDGKFLQQRVYDPRGTATKVAKILFAESLKNEVAREVRKVPSDAANLPKRAALIELLLQKARADAWLYDEALQHAKLYLESSGGHLDGYRWMLRVLREKGDVAAELALLQSLKPDATNAAFRLESLGAV